MAVLGDQVEAYNIAADVSPTASQMPRLVGLALCLRSVS
jgi:hypothetical protein